MPRTKIYNSFFHFACRSGIASDKTTIAHWIFEKLPQVRIYFEALKVDNKLKLFIGHDLADFQELILDLLKVKKENIFTKKIPYSIHVKNLFISRIYITHTSRIEFDPIGRNWVKDRLRESIEQKFPQVKNESKKIAFSRKMCARRKLIDEELTYDLLEKRGFEILFPEKMKRIEQIISSYKASTIIGLPSGSGLANMIFANNAKLIDILYQENSSYYTFWFLLSRELGFDYALILGPSCKERRDFRENNLKINIKKLEQTLSI